jgi:hypothetical protein
MDAPREEGTVAAQVDDESQEAGCPLQPRTGCAAASDLPEGKRISGHEPMIQSVGGVRSTFYTLRGCVECRR